MTPRMSLLRGAVLGTCCNQDAFSELPLSGRSSDIDPRIMGFSTGPWNHSNKTITSSPRANGHPSSCEADAAPGVPALAGVTSAWAASLGDR